MKSPRSQGDELRGPFFAAPARGEKAGFPIVPSPRGTAAAPSLAVEFEPPEEEGEDGER